MLHIFTITATFRDDLSKNNPICNKLASKFAIEVLDCLAAYQGKNALFALFFPPVLDQLDS